MATIKTWVVTLEPKRVLVPDTSAFTDRVNEEVVVAHSLVIEPSGALSFWVVSADGMMSVLVLAFAAGRWDAVKILNDKPQVPAVTP